MIIVLLPAYNEAKSLPQILPKLNQTLTCLDQEFLIIICDDGSNDGTSEVARGYIKEIPLVILRHEINRGLGETSRDLFEYAANISEDDDIIIRLDCDDTHEPKYIEALTQKIAEGNDVVIASRFQKGGGQLGVNRYRAFVSRCANLFMKILFPIPGLKEYSSGFRAYRAIFIKKAIKFYKNDFIQLKGLGFTCTLEKLVKLKMLGAKFSEIPFILRYDQKKSQSKMISSITTYGYFTMAFLYHWPFGGWKRNYTKILKLSNKS